MENTASYKVVEEDVHQAAEYGQYMETIGWKTIKVGKRQIFIRKMGPGAIAKIQRVDLPILWEEIREVLIKYRVFMCKLEPMDGAEARQYEELKRQGFRLDTWPLLGTKTLRVDLRPDENDIFDGFKKDARYCIKKGSMSNVQCAINEFDRFYEIWKKAARRKNLWIPGKAEFMSLVECFGDKCFCITINDLSGNFILTHKQTAFYFYSGNSPEGKQSQLPYLTVWEAMKEAKRRGCKTWDFEGIFDARWPNKRWQGFSHFKKSFGGEEVEFPGCFSRWSLEGIVHALKHNNNQQLRP